MSTRNSIENENRVEKGDEKIDVSEKLAEDVYASGVLSRENEKFSPVGLRLRALAGKFGTEEGGIERVPPEARTDQHPRDLFFFFSSSTYLSSLIC